MHFYSEEEIEYLRVITLGRYNKEITKMFNKKFSLNQTEKAIAGVRKRHKIKSELGGKFGEGHIPWNKGMKGLDTGGKETRFKKGHKPHNYLPVGSERVNGDGYVDIKISDPNKWRGKHIVVWEKHNGPVPKGHAVIFGDRNRRNFDPNNLVLVSRRQLSILNKNKLIQNNADSTRTAVIMADLYQKISERNSH